MDLLTPTNILFLITIATVLVNIYLSLKKPQEKGETNDAVFNERFTQFDRELANLRDNHLHTIGVKLDDHVQNQTKNEMLVCEKLARLETKLDVLITK